MAKDTYEEPNSDLVKFAAVVRQVGAEIVAAVEQGRFDQAKELATYLCMAAALIEQAGEEVVEVDPYDLARLKVSFHEGDSKTGD
jgi:hypothetical protein